MAEAVRPAKKKKKSKKYPVERLAEEHGKVLEKEKGTCIVYDEILPERSRNFGRVNACILICVCDLCDYGLLDIFYLVRS